MKELEKLLEKFNKRKLVFEDSISITNENQQEHLLDGSNLGNLKEYE